MAAGRRHGKEDMAEKVTNYQCPNCTGPLHYDSATGKLHCDFCGSSFDVAEIEALYAEREKSASEAMHEEEEKRQRAAQEPSASQAQPHTEEQTQAAGSAGEDWDYTGISDDWGEDAGKMRVYHCPSCGAELICDETTGATSCPYCGNPTIVPGQFSGILRPDYVIPFRLEKEAAVNALKEHCKGKPFLPKSFQEDNHIQKMQGIYVPFWLFDGQAEGWADYEATKVRVFRRGDEEITQTDFYDVYREGSLAFEKVPVDASGKMQNDYMDSVEPYDYSELKPFSLAYLPGYLADKYDVTAQECAERADRRCEQTLLDHLTETVQGFSSVRRKNDHVTLTRGEVHYALLPVWVLNTRWQDKDFLFIMNGQTGRIVGDLPVSRAKYWLTFGIIAAVLMAVICLFYYVL